MFLENIFVIRRGRFHICPFVSFAAGEDIILPKNKGDFNFFEKNSSAA